jgi:hypothetical protein
MIRHMDKFNIVCDHVKLSAAKLRGIMRALPISVKYMKPLNSLDCIIYII